MPDLESILSDRQRRTAATAITLLSLAVIVGAVLFSFWLLVKFFRAFDHVFLPLAMAGVLALVIRPYDDWLQRRAHLSPSLAVVVVLLSLVIPLVAAALLFGSVIITQLNNLLEALPDWWATLSAWIEERRPELKALFEENPIARNLKETLQSPDGPILNLAGILADGLFAVGAGVFSSVVSLLGWIVFPVYLIFFLLAPRLNWDAFGDAFPFLKAGTREDVVFLARKFVDLVVTFFRGQLLIVLMQGVLFAIGFTLVGLRYGAVLGLTLGFFNLVPYLGNMIGLVVCLPLALAQDGGGWMLLVWVLVVIGAVQAVEGYLLTPRIMGDRTGLHPVVIIVAIFFWGSALDGILGMILAIPLTAFLVVFWQVLRDKYIPKLV